MPDPSAGPTWERLLLALLGLLGAGNLGSQLLTLRQARAKGEAEARREEATALAGPFEQATLLLDRYERRIEQLEAECDRLRERVRAHEDEIANLRRMVRELGGDPGTGTRSVLPSA